MLHKNSVLHKSFKPAKCKTALKMTSSRIKLLKNKRETQLRQLKREVAQLLESGQDRTARIRVEHVVREEKTMAAYELIEIYCELIVARLAMIESQKNCPIDLKEAISSVIFASPRCADIPELMDVHKLFKVKYGKEFVTAAVELRPDCGVSRLLVEKLSAKAPDGPTKIKILSTIAEEHNIKWDSELFGETEMKPHEDLLNGPNNFEQASKLHVKPPHVQEPLNSVDKGPPSFQVSSKHYEKHDLPVNSNGPSSNSSPYSQNFPSTDVGTNTAMPTATSHPDLRYQRAGAEGLEFKYPHAGDGSGLSSRGKSWNMEFKDATAAAQAAAESAERASMAARAAAKLSSQGRISRQHSTKSQYSSAFGSGDQGLENVVGRKLQGEHLGEGPSNDNEQDELAGLMERFYNLKSPNKPSRSVSSKSSSASVDDYQSVNDVQMADRYSQKSSSELPRSDRFGEVSIKSESSESEVEFVSEMQDATKYENTGHFEEANIRRLSSNASSRSHSRASSEVYNVFSNIQYQKSVEQPAEDPFVIDERKFKRNTTETDSYNNSTVAFDYSGSDNDEIKFDTMVEHDVLDPSSYFSSEGRKSFSQLLTNTDAWASSKSMGESVGKSSSRALFPSEQHSTFVFSEGTNVFSKEVVHSQPADTLPFIFDNSDGPSTDSEEELDKSNIVGSKSTGIFLNRHSVYSRDFEPTHNESPHSIRSSLGEKEHVGSKREKWLWPSSVDSNLEVRSKRNPGIEVKTENVETFNLHTRQPSPGSLKSQTNSNDFTGNLQTTRPASIEDNFQIQQALDTMQDTKPIKESSLERGKQLNFGTLTGGLRNKGYRRPPYLRDQPDKHSLSKQVTEYDSTGIEQSSLSGSVNIGSGVHEKAPYNQTRDLTASKRTSSSSSVKYVSSGDEANKNSDEEPQQLTFNRFQEPYNQELGIETNKKSSLKTYFDSDGDSDVDLPIDTSTSKPRSNTGFSRRTKAAPSNSARNPYSKATLFSDNSVNSDSFAKEKSSKSYHATETRPKLQHQIRSSDYLGSSEQRQSAEHAASKLGPQSKTSSLEESSSRSSSATHAQQNSFSRSKDSDSRKIFGQSRSAKQVVSTPIPESKSSSRIETVKSSTGERPSNPINTVALGSGSAESSKASSLQAKPPSREDSISRASHVHPKLPDYDTLTAHLLSLRQNRQ